MFYNFHQALQMWQDSAAHQDCYLLNDFNTGVTRLPGLLTATNGFQEGKKRRDPKSGCDNGERPRRRVTYVLVDIVDVRSHCRDHCGQTCSFSQV